MASMMPQGMGRPDFGGEGMPVRSDGAKGAPGAGGDKEALSGGMPKRSESSDDAQPKSDSKAESRLQNMIDSLDIPDGYKAIVVETGLSDESFIEIKQGLSEGDKVLLPDTTESTNTQNPMMGGMPGGMGGGMPGGMGGGMPGGGRGGRGGRNNIVQ